jgi:hypothetical protein
VRLRGAADALRRLAVTGELGEGIVRHAAPDVLIVTAAEVMVA